jgi:hypothetical protein
VSFDGGRDWMRNNTYLLCGNGNDLVDREVRVCAYEFIVDYFSSGSDPLVVPVGVTKIF